MDSVNGNLAEKVYFNGSDTPCMARSIQKYDNIILISDCNAKTDQPSIIAFFPWQNFKKTSLISESGLSYLNWSNID